MPKVSVIIPTFNRFTRLQQAVESVLNQTYSDFELIIIDDGSTDETFKHYVNCRPPIRYFYQPNLGVSAARNRGIKLSEGDFIAFLDSDDQWKPQKLERHLDFFEKNPEILISQTEDIWIRHDKRVNPKKKHRKPSGQIFNEALRLCVVSPSSVMMKSGFFDEVGHFDENMPACEDYDLWLRTAYKFSIPLLEDPLTIKFGGHEDQLSKMFWGMDRFRVYAIQKLLRLPLSDEQLSLAKSELRKKCKILLNGSLKRLRFFFAIKVLLTKILPGRNWNLL